MTARKRRRRSPGRRAEVLAEARMFTVLAVLVARVLKAFGIL